MHTNLKIETIRRIMDKLHERQARNAADLSRLCALLTDLATEHAEACGADGEVVAAIIAPKEEP